MVEACLLESSFVLNFVFHFVRYKMDWLRRSIQEIDLLLLVELGQAIVDASFIRPFFGFITTER